MERNAHSFMEHPAVQLIRALLLDPEVTEIMVNGPAQVFVERGGLMQPAGVRFRDEAELMVLIRALLSPMGRDISSATPYMDFRLPDGSRGNVIIPPLALNGPVLTLRKFTRHVKNVDDMIRRGTLTGRMGQLLVAAVRARANIVFSGAAGTGKTTTLGIFARFIPETERIITIEDTAELNLHQANVVRLECRKPNLEGRGEITLAELVRNSLRMRPTRIVVGEVRGDEATDMIQAITSGHHGCLVVIHASSPEDTVSRLEIMLLSRGLLLPLWAIHRQIASAIDLIVQHDMLPDGSRKITRISEVAGAADNRVLLQDIFEYQHGGDAPGHWRCAGAAPRILAKCQRYGVELAPKVYAEGVD
ncbi:MAG: CpaF family protein [Phycisphaerae bacterium]